MTAGRDDIVATLIGEFRSSRGWVTLAAAVGLVEISSFVAREADVRPILGCVNDDPTMHLISAGLHYRRMPKPIPIEPLLNEMLARPDASDRAAAVMEYLIDVDDGPGTALHRRGGIST